VKRIPVRFLIFVSAILISLSPACGKKAPPFVPEKKLTAKVDRLTGTWKNGEVRLEGYIADDDKRRSDVSGCRVYHAWYPAQHPPCEGCPIEMTGFKEITDARVSGDRFVCDIPGVEKKGLWFFEVRLIGGSGAVGPPSERIKLKIED